MRRTIDYNKAKQQGRQNRRERRSILPTGFQYDQSNEQISELVLNRDADGEQFVLVSATELAQLRENQKTFGEDFAKYKEALDFIQTLI